MRIIVVDTRDKAKVLLQDVINGDFELKLIVIMQSPQAELEALAQQANVEIMKFSDVEALGSKNVVAPVVSYDNIPCVAAMLVMVSIRQLRGAPSIFQRGGGRF